MKHCIIIDDKEYQFYRCPKCDENYLFDIPLSIKCYRNGSHRLNHLNITPISLEIIDEITVCQNCNRVTYGKYTYNQSCITCKNSNYIPLRELMKI